MDTISVNAVFRCFDATIGRYLRMYYLADEYRHKILAQDIEAIVFERIQAAELTERNQPVPSMVIHYTDILAEKLVSSEAVLAVLQANEAYRSDCLAPLTAETVEVALGLNRKLIQLETDVMARCALLNEEMQQRVKNYDDISDYEIELHFTFFLKEDDPYAYDGAAFWDCHYTSDDCAIVAEVRDNGKRAVSPDHWGIGNTFDYCDMRGSALCVERHCWLFRQLHDQYSIPFSHLERIGEVWTDIKVNYQNQWPLT